LERIYNVYLPYACYGVVAKDGTITETPPIAAWARGKKLSDFARWVAKKGGKICCYEKNSSEETKATEEG
jgi:hypothetical protein